MLTEYSKNVKKDAVVRVQNSNKLLHSPSAVFENTAENVADVI